MTGLIIICLSLIVAMGILTDYLIAELVKQAFGFMLGCLIISGLLVAGCWSTAKIFDQLELTKVAHQGIFALAFISYSLLIKLSAEKNIDEEYNRLGNP